MEEELVKLERYQTALAHLSEELDKLKQADGNLPEVTSFICLLGDVYMVFNMVKCRINLPVCSKLFVSFSQ